MASIKVVNLPGLAVKGDIVDWIKTPGNDYTAFMEIVRNTPARETQSATLPEPKPYKPLFITGYDLINEAIVVKKLIGRVIERGCTGQIFGPSGDGKSFIAVDMLIAIAIGGKWNGIQCEQGLVLYFAGEGHNGIKRRLKASSSHNGNPDLSLFNVSRSVISFDDSSLRQVVTEVRALEEHAGQKVAFIVIDTLARHLNGDENSTQHMSEFIRLVDGLRYSFPDSTALIVHHTGNNAEANGRSRGSSALKAAMDFEIQCMSGTLTFTKLKDGEPPPPVEFKLQVVDLGYDADGEPVTSCVPVYGEKSAKNRQQADKPLTKSNRTLFGIIEKHETGEIEDIRPIFYEREHHRLCDPGTKQDTLKKSFARAIEFLCDTGAATREGSILKTRQRDKAGQIAILSRHANGTFLSPPLYKGEIVPHVSRVSEVVKIESEDAEFIPDNEFFFDGQEVPFL